MSKVVTISKLEALLARIRTRAAEPRPPREALGAPAPVPAAPPVTVVRAPEPPPAVVAAEPATPRAVRPPSPPPQDTLEETTLPPPPLVDVSSDADFEVEVEVPISSPEPPAAEKIEGKDSGERLSAAPPVGAEPAAAEAATRVEVISDEEGVADEDEALDEAPASSRRPVMPPPEERLAELAFGSEEPQSARHTPPPKSGRLPAPPAGDFDPDVTGVRVTPGLSVEEEATPLSAPPVEPSVLSPQPVRAQLASGTNVRVPDVIGDAQAFAPATFLALLDASLSL